MRNARQTVNDAAVVREDDETSCFTVEREDGEDVLKRQSAGRDFELDAGRLIESIIDVGWHACTCRVVGFIGNTFFICTGCSAHAPRAATQAAVPADLDGVGCLDFVAELGDAAVDDDEFFGNERVGVASRGMAFHGEIFVDAHGECAGRLFGDGGGAFGLKDCCF